MDFFFLLFPYIFLLFFMGFVGLFIYAMKANKKRMDELAQRAKSMQLAFSPLAPKSFTEDLAAMSYFADPLNRVLSTVLYGQAGGLSVHIFEYTISQNTPATSTPVAGTDGTISHSHPQSTSTTYSAVYLRGNTALPRFLLRSSSFLDGVVKKLFGMQDINFDTHPVFSKEWVLQGENELEVRKLFTPELLSYCEKMPKDTLVGEGERLVFMRIGPLMPDQVEGLLREAMSLHQLFSQSARA